MATQKGSLVLLKIGNGGAPETFTSIGGMRVNRMVVNNAVIDSSQRASGVWRTLMSAAGNRSIMLEGEGLFTDAISEETLRGYAFAGSINNYEMTFGNGDKLAGAFLVKHYERSGNVEREETCHITLESAGAMTFYAT